MFVLSKEDIKLFRTYQDVLNKASGDLTIAEYGNQLIDIPEIYQLTYTAVVMQLTQDYQKSILLIDFDKAQVNSVELTLLGLVLTINKKPEEWANLDIDSRKVMARLISISRQNTSAKVIEYGFDNMLDLSAILTRCFEPPLHPTTFNQFINAAIEITRPIIRNNPMQTDIGITDNEAKFLFRDRFNEPDIFQEVAILKFNKKGKRFIIEEIRTAQKLPDSQIVSNNTYPLIIKRPIIIDSSAVLSLNKYFDLIQQTRDEIAEVAALFANHKSLESIEKKFQAHAVKLSKRKSVKFLHIITGMATCQLMLQDQNHTDQVFHTAPQLIANEIRLGGKLTLNASMREEMASQYAMDVDKLRQLDCNSRGTLQFEHYVARLLGQQDRILTQIKYLGNVVKLRLCNSGLNFGAGVAAMTPSLGLIPYCSALAALSLALQLMHDQEVDPQQRQLLQDSTEVDDKNIRILEFQRCQFYYKRQNGTFYLSQKLQLVETALCILREQDDYKKIIEPIILCIHKMIAENKQLMHDKEQEKCIAQKILAEKIIETTSTIENKDDVTRLRKKVQHENAFIKKIEDRLAILTKNTRSDTGSDDEASENEHNEIGQLKNLLSIFVWQHKRNQVRLAVIDKKISAAVEGEQKLVDIIEIQLQELIKRDESFKNQLGKLDLAIYIYKPVAAVAAQATQSIKQVFEMLEKHLPPKIDLHNDKELLNKLEEYKASIIAKQEHNKRAIMAIEDKLRSNDFQNTILFQEMFSTLKSQALRASSVDCNGLGNDLIRENSTLQPQYESIATTPGNFIAYLATQVKLPVDQLPNFELFKDILSYFLRNIILIDTMAGKAATESEVKPYLELFQSTDTVTLLDYCHTVYRFVHTLQNNTVWLKNIFLETQENLIELRNYVVKNIFKEPSIATIAEHLQPSFNELNQISIPKINTNWVDNIDKRKERYFLDVLSKIFYHHIINISLYEQEGLPLYLQYLREVTENPKKICQCPLEKIFINSEKKYIPIPLPIEFTTALAKNNYIRFLHEAANHGVGKISCLYEFDLDKSAQKYQLVLNYKFSIKDGPARDCIKVIPATFDRLTVETFISTPLIKKFVSFFEGYKLHDMAINCFLVLAMRIEDYYSERNEVNKYGVREAGTAHIIMTQFVSIYRILRRLQEQTFCYHYSNYTTDAMKWLLEYEDNKCPMVQEFTTEDGYLTICPGFNEVVNSYFSECKSRIDSKRTLFISSKEYGILMNRLYKKYDVGLSLSTLLTGYPLETAKSLLEQAGIPNPAHFDARNLDFLNLYTYIANINEMIIPFKDSQAQKMLDDFRKSPSPITSVMLHQITTTYSILEKYLVADATAKFDAKQFDHALKTHQLLLRFFPNNSTYYCGLALCYTEMGNTRGAIEAYSKAIEIGKQNSQKNHITYFARGSLYATLKDYETALDDFKYAIVSGPDKAEYFTARGEIFIALQRFDEALLDLNMAIGLEPSNPKNYLLCSLIAEIKNDSPQAKEYFEMGSSLESRNETNPELLDSQTKLDKKSTLAKLYGKFGIFRVCQTKQDVLLPASIAKCEQTSNATQKATNT